MTWSCHDCEHLFEQPEERRVCDGPSEAWGVRELTHSVLEVCPECESADIEECAMCTECAEEPSADGVDLCLACLAMRIVENQAPALKERTA
jgi:hypothetical protein